MTSYAKYESYNFHITNALEKNSIKTTQISQNFEFISEFSNELHNLLLMAQNNALER